MVLISRFRVFEIGFLGGVWLLFMKKHAVLKNESFLGGCQIEIGCAIAVGSPLKPDI